MRDVSRAGRKIGWKRLEENNKTGRACLNSKKTHYIEMVEYMYIERVRFDWK